MAKAPIDIALGISGLSDLQKLERKMQQLETQVAKLDRTLPKAANGIRKTGRAAASATGNIQRLGIAFRTTLAPIVAITGSIALMNKALNTVGGRNAELASLKNGLDGLVDSSDAAAEALLKIADKSGKATLFDEEDFTATFKLLTSFRNIGVDAYDRVSMAAADMAQVIGTKPKEAAMQLAKALEDPSRRVTDLARSGTVFTEQQKEQIRVLQQSGDLLGAQGIILAEIEKQYGGAAKAAGASGFAGALDGAGESWRDFLETLGQANEAGAVEFLNGISQGLDFLTQNFDVIDAAGRAVVDTIALPFKAMLEGIQSAIGPIKNFEGIFRGTLGVVTKVLKDLTQNILVPVFRIVGQGIGNVIKYLGGLVQGVGTAMEGVVSTVTGALRIIARAMEAFINASPLGLLQLFGINAGAVASGALNSYADGIDSMAASVGNYASELKDAYAAAQNVPGLDSSGSSSNPFAGAGPKGAAGIVEEGGSGAAAKAAAKAAEKLANDIERANRAAQKLTKSFAESAQPLRAQLEDQEKLNALMQGGEKLEAAQQEVDRARELLDIRMEGVKALEELREIENLGADELAKAEEEVRAVVEERLKLQKQLNAAKNQTAGLTKAEKDAETAAKDQAQAIEQTAKDFASTIAGGFKNILVTAVKGGDIKQAFTQLIDGLANKFLDIAFSQIENSLTKAFTGLLGGEDRNNMTKQQIVQTEAQAIQMFGQYVTMFQSSVSQMGAMGGGGGGLGGLFGGGGGIGGLFSGLAGGGVGGTVGLGGGMSSFMPLGPGFSVFEGGGYTGNGPRSGGLDGKGGYMAMVHPNETIVDHHGAMGRYSAGGGGGGGGSKTIRFESTVINNVEYVTMDQAQQMSRQAADDGAKRGAAGGHSKSMRTLQNSRSQRAKLGMS